MDVEDIALVEKCLVSTDSAASVAVASESFLEQQPQQQRPSLLRKPLDRT